MSSGPATWRRALIWVTAPAVLVGIFALYVQPDLALTIANQLWACF
jgi:hypothetical protein